MPNHVHNFLLAVDLFLIISGFVIAYVYSGRLHTLAQYGKFLRRRFARLAPLHWLTLFFFVGLGLLVLTGKFHTDHPEDYNWRCLAPNFLALHAFGLCPGLSFNFVSWSISAEMGMYLIAPILLALAARSDLGILALSFLSMGFLIFIAPGLGLPKWHPWYEWTSDFGVLRALPDFTFGLSLYALRRVVVRLPWPRLWLTAGLLALLAGAYFEWPMPICLVIVYMTTTAGVAADLRAYPPNWASRLGAGGQLTYSVYMLHPVMLTVFLSFVGQKLLHLGGTLANIWLALIFMLTFLVSLASYKLFEVPARKFLSGPSRSPSKPSALAQ